MSGFVQRVKALFSKAPKQGPAVQQQPVYQQQPQPQPQPQPQFAPQPQYVQQPAQYMQQPMQYMQQPQYVQHQHRIPSQYMPQQPMQQPYPPYIPQQPMQQPSPFENATQMPNYFASPPSAMFPNNQNSSIQANNQNGVIDRDGFRKLFIASLLNMTWQDIERESEATFRRFDINQSGVLDFNEYMQACSRMILGGNQQPPMNQY